jgi:glucuronate isomerase
MLHSQGVPLEALGIPGANGAPLAPVQPREVWRTFAAHYHLFRGTPVRRGAAPRGCGCARAPAAAGLADARATGAPTPRRCAQTSLWFREALARTFNITEKLSPASADRMCAPQSLAARTTPAHLPVMLPSAAADARARLRTPPAARSYDAVDGALRSARLRPAALLDEFNIEVLATTNAATDDLAAHLHLQAGPLRGRVIPTFRPDEVCDLARPSWRAALGVLAKLTGEPCDTFASFLAALRARRAAFAAAGATAADHGAELPVAAPLPAGKAEELFRTALRKGPGAISPADAAAFRAHMLVEHARMSAADGLVMQLHAGVARDHDAALAARFGPDRGGDIPLAADWTRGLAPLLAELGHAPNLTLVLFTLDEATYSRELAPLAGVYPVLRLGPPWWFLDSLAGARRYLDAVVETAGVANLAGFNDDTRALLSVPARHGVWRRAVADWAAEQHARGVLDWEDARAVAYDLAYGNAKKTYKLK